MMSFGLTFDREGVVGSVHTVKATVMATDPGGLMEGGREGGREEREGGRRGRECGRKVRESGNIKT